MPDNVTLHPITFDSKRLLSAEQCYSNTKHEAMGILLGLMKFPHYCFAMEVCIFTYHKPLVAILTRIWPHCPSNCSALCCGYTNTGYTLHTSLAQTCITDWLSRNNHDKDRDQEITRININVTATSKAINVPVYKSIEDIQAAKI